MNFAAKGKKNNNPVTNWPIIKYVTMDPFLYYAIFNTLGRNVLQQINNIDQLK